MFTLALVQLLVEGGRPAENLDRAALRVAEAARLGADLALLPEALDLGWTHPSAAHPGRAGEIPGGAACAALAALAAEHRIYLCAGLVERCGDAVYNAGVLIDRGGEVVLVHRKLNELEIAQPSYRGGDRLGVHRCELGTLGVMVCADAFAPGEVIPRALGHLGADVILSPCAWAVPPGFDHDATPYGGRWRAVYRPVARDFSLWVAAASCVGPLRAGPWAGHACIGCSMVVDPAGETVLQAPFGEGAEAVLTIAVEPAPRPARGTGWARLWGCENPD